jgi:DNA-binding NarL/FixJ family response regulator
MGEPAVSGPTASAGNVTARRSGPAPEHGVGPSSSDLRTAVILVKLPLWVTALRGLAESSDIRVVGSTGEPERALELISRLRPGVFINEIDGQQGELNLEVVRDARRIDPELRVIVLAKEREQVGIVDAFRAGVDVYVVSDADPDDVVAGMRQLFNQSLFIAADWALGAVHAINNNLPDLTRREVEILQLVAEGHTNGSLATMLSVTEQTIKFHLTNIYRKLEVHNRTEASRWATLHGVLPNSQTPAGGAVRT